MRIASKEGFLYGTRSAISHIPNGQALGGHGLTRCHPSHRKFRPVLLNGNDTFPNDW